MHKFSIEFFALLRAVTLCVAKCHNYGLLHCVWQNVTINSCKHNGELIQVYLARAGLLIQLVHEYGKQQYNICNKK
jgi:hypothetical protein